MTEKWIQGAIKTEGGLTRMARRAGMSISEYCSRKNLSTLAKRRCNLWRTLKKMKKG